MRSFLNHRTSFSKTKLQKPTSIYLCWPDHVPLPMRTETSKTLLYYERVSRQIIWGVKTGHPLFNLHHFTPTFRSRVLLRIHIDHNALEKVKSKDLARVGERGILPD